VSSDAGSTPPEQQLPAHIWNDEAGARDAPLIVLIHGSMDRSAGMLKVSRRLDDRFRVLRYDRRGYGRSAPHAGPFDMDAQVADLLELIAGREAVLVAHSYGGNVGLAAAARHPDIVRGVALYETPLTWMPWWPVNTAGTAAVEEPGPTDVAADRFMRRMLGDVRWEALPERVRHQRLTEGAALVGELSDLLVNPPWQAHEIAVPVALGYGTEGRAHHRDGMTRLSTAIPGATLVELTGLGHDAPLNAPGPFCTELVEPLLTRVGVPWSVTAAGRS
jgi:pimeloyl-ACP methyl ester carboxylesterase